MAPDAWHTQQSVAALRRGLLPIIGDGSSYLSLIHAEDAAQAVVRVVERPEIAGGKVYNVVDKLPATMAEVFPFAARSVGGPAPKRIPAFLAKMLVGSLTLDILIASYRMTGERIRNELGFAPNYPTYRETWTQIGTELSGREIAPTDDLS